MVKDKMLRLLYAKRRQMDDKRRELNLQVKAASGGKLHSQACPLGGLGTGMAASFDGGPCWCGAMEE